MGDITREIYHMQILHVAGVSTQITLLIVHMNLRRTLVACYRLVHRTEIVFNAHNTPDTHLHVIIVSTHN